MIRKLILLGLFLSLVAPVILAASARPVYANEWRGLSTTTQRPKDSKNGGDTPRPKPTPGPKDGG